MKDFISILNKNKANELKALGFNYISNKIGNEMVYTFHKTDELMKYLNSNFSESEYFNGNLPICF